MVGHLCEIFAKQMFIYVYTFMSSIDKINPDKAAEVADCIMNLTTSN